MDLFNLITTFTSIVQIAFCNRALSFESYVPRILYDNVGFDTPQKTFRGTGEDTSNQGITVSMRNSTKRGDDIIFKSNVDSRQDQTDHKVKIKEIHDLLIMARTLLSTIPKKGANESYDPNTIKDPPAQLTLDDMVKTNKKRAQAIKDFNINFPLLFKRSRRTGIQEQIRPSVELGPGSYKSEIVTYPPNFLERRLKYLVKYAEAKRLLDEQFNF